MFLNLHIIIIYRPVSISIFFSKMHEKFSNEQLLPFVNRSLSELMPARRSGYSTNEVWIRIIENCNHFTCTGLMDLSKTFDCILHDLLIAKLHAYGLDFGTVTFLHNYLKCLKQSVKINSISSFFRTILSSVPKGSILASTFL